MIWNTSDEDLAYIAGFLDGEGCFSINGSIQVKCNHTYLPVLKFLQEKLGGTIGDHSNIPSKKQSWTWRVSGKNAYLVCEYLKPLLKEKKYHATLLSDWYRSVGTRGKRVSEENKIYRSKLKEKLRERDSSRVY